MGQCVKRISVDTSALPKTKALFQKIFPIIKKRIEDRCGTACCENDTEAQFVLRFVIDETVPAEGFQLNDEDGTLVVRGADFLALMYGAGQFLHKSRYTAEGIIPTDWRGQSVPQTSHRIMYFALHFFNWYQCCSEDEIREYIEDLVLWGINGVGSIFPFPNLTGWDDPNVENAKLLFCKTLKAARELGLKVGFIGNNVDFKEPRKELGADRKYFLSQTGNMICPSTEEGFAYCQELLSKVLDMTDEFGGVDYLIFWPYDEGGCCCDECWPWAGKGFYHMSHRLAEYVRTRYPKIEIWISSWYIGRGEHQKEEWPMLYQRLQEDAAKGDNWLDYILLETRGDYPECFYAVQHGQPTPHTKLLTFPEISMVGVSPWGGFGAVCTPKTIRSQEEPFAPLCDGGYMYTEGIYDDINKVCMLGNLWDRNRTDEETLSDYCTYECTGVDPTDFVRLVELIEASHMCTNRYVHKPCNLEDCDAAWELAQKMNEDAAPEIKQYWRWRILYLRAYLDKVRYHRCAELGWPLLQQPTGWFRFWRRFLEHDEQAQEYMLELIHLYKAQEIDDPERYAYHYYLRPPMTRGADLEAELKTAVSMA